MKWLEFELEFDPMSNNFCTFVKWGFLPCSNDSTRNFKVPNNPAEFKYKIFDKLMILRDANCEIILFQIDICKKEFSKILNQRTISARNVIFLRFQY